MFGFKKIIISRYSLCPKLSVAFGFRAASLTRFIENAATSVSPNKFIKKTRFKNLSNDTNYTP
jgi:hypothetical protein